ncbi:uncharacterized protein MJAP1_003015 [Malassezia japonica]|uniref:Protein ROT1 n=1 Tax=Malassezia japonica TaxID=223818 RepID=A0AAF0JB15_9BASI|nr:uncharacterized protein MJAP1_003015 [Malassezia japonica]WFD40033.1 hypothetical protein MJAP1_003015 [Malassezia japonica]
MARAPALEVQGVLQAQWEREARGEQASGHLIKVLSLFAHAAVRYALWAAGQVPEPLDTLALHARYALDEQGEDAEVLVPAVSYAVNGAVPGDVPRGIRDARLRAIVELVHASTQLEAQLYGAFASIQNDAPHLVHLAVVHGASLHFAKAVWVWSLEDVLAPAPSHASDSPAAETQRKKVAALLERKLDAPPPEEEEAMEEVDEEADAAPPANDTPERVSRMHLPTSTINRVYIAAALFSAATVHCQKLKVPNPPVMDTSLDGTWSTGTGAVETGQKYFNLVNISFNIPQNSGQSYSFKSSSPGSTTGYWEQLLYQYSVLTDLGPGCYQSQLIWQHGNYTILNDNRIILEPYGPDGRQQVSSPCERKNDQVGYYGHRKEEMKGFDITTYLHYGQPSYKLQLYEFDGTLKPSMYLKYRPAAMYPTMPLHMNVIGVAS